MNQNKTFAIAVGVGLFIFLLLNLIVAEMAEEKRFLSSIPSDLINKRLTELEASDGLWLVGNSTLDDGIEKQIIADSLGLAVAKVPLGSATLDAMSRLAMKALEDSDKLPKMLCIFVSKDDFNRNGSRAQQSKSYLSALEGIQFEDWVLSAIPLYSYRFSLRNEAEAAVVGLFKAGKAKGGRESSEMEEGLAAWEASGGQEVQANTSYLINLGKNYALDFGGLPDLAQTCKARGIRLCVVLMPVTHAAVNWHDATFPELPYQDIVQQLGDSVTQHGGVFLDKSFHYPSTTAVFKDEYHLKPAAAKDFTSKTVVSDLSEIL